MSMFMPSSNFDNVAQGMIEFLFWNAPFKPSVMVYQNHSKMQRTLLLDFKFSMVRVPLEADYANPTGYKWFPDILSMFSAADLILPREKLENMEKRHLMVVGGYRHGESIFCDLWKGSVITTVGDLMAIPGTAPNGAAMMQGPATQALFANQYRREHIRFSSWVLAPAGEKPSFEFIEATLTEFPALSVLTANVLFAPRLFRRVLVSNGIEEVPLEHCSYEGSM